jgi:NAD(P)H-hydrate epimerase
MKIVTSEQMRRIEERSEQAGVSTDRLMENAGLAVARSVRRRLGRVVGARVVVLAGPGNNGGDGLVAARRLLSWGADVTVYLTRDRVGDPNLDSVVARCAPVVSADEADFLRRLAADLGRAQVVVDALLGTGRSRPIAGVVETVLRALSQARKERPSLRLLAVDLPTGLDADTGCVDPESVSADATMALGYPKVGHYAGSGAGHCGTVEVVDIGVPPTLDADVRLELMTAEWARALLPGRPPDAHKGTFGRVLIVAGSRSYVGAAKLAATAATRAGAGLVTLAVPESLRGEVASGSPEPTYLPLPEFSPGVHSPTAAGVIMDRAGGYDALLVGCGLGLEDGTVEMVERLLYGDARLPPTVIDADALNVLARSQELEWWERLPRRVVVTPHPGEMGRLADEPAAAVQDDRIGAALRSAEKWNKVVVLKGAHTVVASPDGDAMVSPFANPGLASAGTGDVLAGIIAGLLAQGLDLGEAAALGVYLHGSAGERVRHEMGDAGMLASDLLPALPRSIKELRRGTGG